MTRLRFVLVATIALLVISGCGPRITLEQAKENLAVAKAELKRVEAVKHDLVVNFEASIITYEKMAATSNHGLTDEYAKLIAELRYGIRDITESAAKPIADRQKDVAKAQAVVDSLSR